MIRSEMISFRPQYVQQRKLSQYIQLIQQVFEKIKQNSSQKTFNINSIASSIRQIVLKNDCLEQKDDLLEFYFMCQKNIQSLQGRKNNNKKQPKTNWTNIIQNNINKLYAYMRLYEIQQNYKVRKCFDAIANITRVYKKQIQSKKIEEIQVDLSKIQVEQDIKVKTLYFFKWCKFVEYCNTIKKLRLKQIDDLRKSLTFNQYAVKFSYFQNWRKFAKNNAKNRKIFQSIQDNSKKYLFKQTIDSFYTLFEIQKIEQKLVQKVDGTLKKNAMIYFFKKFALNKIKQTQKNLQQKKNWKISSALSNYKSHLLKYRFMNHFVQTLGFKPQSSKTLKRNYKYNQNIFSLLCAKLSLKSLKDKVQQKNQSIKQIQNYRKSLCLQSSFQFYTKNKNVQKNQQILSKNLKINKLKKVFVLININFKIKTAIKDLDKEFRCLEEGSEYQFDSLSEINEGESLHEGLDSQRQHKNLQNQIRLIKSSKTLKHALRQQYIIESLNKMKENVRIEESFKSKRKNVVLLIQSNLLKALKQNYLRIKLADKKNIQLQTIHNKKLLKPIFKALKNYKFVKLNQQQILQSIQQNIFRPNQLSIALYRIQERNHRLQSCQLIFNQVHKLTTKSAFKRCFDDYITRISKVKAMEHQNYKKKLSLLFNFLKNNVKYYDCKTNQIKTEVLLNLSKKTFIKNISQTTKISKKTSQLYLKHLQNRQRSFISTFKSLKEKLNDFAQKYDKVQKYLSFSLFKEKLQSQQHQKQILFDKVQNLHQYLYQKKFTKLLKSMNEIKSSNEQINQKVQTLQKSVILKNAFEIMNKNSLYYRDHTKQIVSSNIAAIQLNIKQKSFLQKLKFYSKSAYLQRLTDWNSKIKTIQKLYDHKQYQNNCQVFTQKIKQVKTLNAWKDLKFSIQLQNAQQRDKKISLERYLGNNRKVEFYGIIQKIKRIKQTFQNQEHLILCLKTKYFAKFMRNSLILKYQKVKQFCAIKSYARSLKSKTFKGLRIMLLRLRDKQNRIRTQQQIIIKVDKALHHSRKSNRLSETINRFNILRQSSVTGGSKQRCR